jgi:hypothetical protein
MAVVSYEFSELPIGHECVLIDAKYMEQYERELVRIVEGGNPYVVGYQDWATPEKIHSLSAEITWYPNTITRFHEVPVIRSACVACGSTLESTRGGEPKSGDGKCLVPDFPSSSLFPRTPTRARIAH